MNTDKKMAKLIVKIFNAAYVHNDQMADFILGVIDNYDLYVYQGREGETIIALEGYYVVIMKYFGALVEKREPKAYDDAKYICLTKDDLIELRG